MAATTREKIAENVQQNGRLFQEECKNTTERYQKWGRNFVSGLVFSNYAGELDGEARLRCVKEREINKSCIASKLQGLKASWQLFYLELGFVAAPNRKIAA